MNINFLKLFFLACFISTITNAQISENAWIVSSQPYLKIKVDQDGIYQVNGTELEQVGWKLAELDASKLQLFYRGKEVPLHFMGIENNRFDSSDAFQFYGKKNDGSRDTLVYRAAERANPYNSLYTDESAYFLTIGKAAGKRVQVISPISSSAIEEPFHIEEEVTAFSNQFTFNNIIGLVPIIQQSYFEKGEGRSGTFIASDTAAIYKINFKNRVQSAYFQSIVEYRINGRSRVNHLLRTSLSDKYQQEFSIEPFGFQTLKNTLDASAIQNNRLDLKIESLQKAELDWYSLTYIKTSYPQQTLMDGKSVKYFNFEKKNPGTYSFKVDDLQSTGLVWDITNYYEPKQLQSVDNKIFVFITSTLRTRLLATHKVLSVKNISPVSFISTPLKSTNFIIITHETLRASANQYAAYRESLIGGEYKTQVVTTQEVYDTFNYGERNPMAIRAYAAYLFSVASPKQLFLIGRGVSFPDELLSDKYPDLVPTVGYPGSDALLTAGLNGFNENVQSIPTGRLNVTKNEEVIAYLAKVKETEANKTPQQWMKNILHLSGGQSIGELQTLKAILINREQTVKTGLLGGKVLARTKQTDQEVEPIDITKEINEGVGMLTFVGHGSASVIDLNIGYCSPPTSGYDNKGKYPIMFFNGCGVGNVFYRYNALSTDWLLTPNKGAIAVFGNSFWSYAYPTERYLEVLYEKLFNDPKTVDLTLGEIQQATNIALLPQIENEYIKANLHQIVLQGDPALRVFPVAKPDYSVNNTSIFILSDNESQPFSGNDSLRVGAIIKNNGRFEKSQNVPFELQKTYANGSVEVQTATFKAIAFQDTVFVKIKKDFNLKSVQLIIDNKNDINELNETNNSGKLEFGNWAEIQDRTSFPDNVLPDRLPPLIFVNYQDKLLINNDIVANNGILEIKLTDNNALNLGIEKHVSVFLKECESCQYKPLTLVDSQANGNKLIVESKLNDLPLGKYELLIIARDAAGNTTSSPYEIVFNVVDKTLETSLTVFPNPSADFVQVRFVIASPLPPTKAKLLIYNMLGNIMKEEDIKPTVGSNSLFYETKGFSAGKYFVKLQIDDFDERIFKAFIVN